MRAIEAIVLMLLIGLSLCAVSATITVPDDYTTIQAAIDAAGSGDTVYIKAGEYVENLVITKPLSIIGEGSALVQVYSETLGQSPSGSVVEISIPKGSCTLAGISILGGRLCMSIETLEGTSVTLEQVVFAYGEIGIQAQGEGKVRVQECLVLETTEIGIFAGVRAMTIDRSEICGGNAGLVIMGDTGLSLRDTSILLVDFAIDTFTHACGWSHGLPAFSGNISGEGNLVFGWETDLCPLAGSALWPNTFVSWKSQAEIALILECWTAAVQKSDAGELIAAVAEAARGVQASSKSYLIELQALLLGITGDILTDLSKYSEAVEAYESARSIYSSRSDEIAAAGMLLNIGNIHLAQLDLAKAAASYESSLAVFSRWGKQRFAALTLGSLGAVYTEMGDYLRALESFETSLAIYSELSLDEEIAAQKNNIGALYLAMEKYAEALEAFLGARTYYDSRGDVTRVAILDMNIGIVYSDMGDYDRALDTYESALDVFEQEGMVEKIADVKTNMGCLYHDLAFYDHAIQDFLHARSIYLSLDLHVRAAQLNNNLGLLYFDLGNLDEALARYSQALEVLFDAGMRRDLADVLGNLGHALVMAGDYEGTLDAYEEAVLFYQEVGLEVAETLLMRNLGLLCLDMGLYSDALEILNSARSILVSHELRVEVASLDNNIGLALVWLERYEEACSVFSEALASLTREPEEDVNSNDRPYSLSWHLHYNYGLALEELGKQTQAIEQYVSSIAVIESIRGNLTSEDIKMAWQERTQDVYDRLIDLLYRMGEGASAFTYAERCRARTFLDALYQGGITADQLISPEAGISSGAVDPEVIAQAVDDAQDMLLPNEAVLEYMVTNNGVYLWVVTADGIAEPEFIEYPREQLMNDVITLRKAIEGSSPDPISTTQFLRSFYEKLVQESLATLPDGVDTLIIIPSGPLWYLPFSALMMVDREVANSTRNPYLVEEYTLAYLPSLATLSSLAEGEATSANVELLLALADPELSPDQLREGEGSKCGPDEELVRYEELVTACQDFADLLVGEEQEEQFVYAGREAQEVLAHRDASRQIVVYAAHGQFNPYVPLESKLLLAPSEEAETADSERRNPDGNYHAWEVLLTDYRGTELVVLAACETLLPHLSDMEGTMAVLADQACDQVELTPQQLEKIVVGDEVVGLARAFLSSGAEAVLGTLWLANPYAIEELLVSMAEYYKKGATWVQALTKAQRELITNDAFKSPWLWAPYQLIGRWR